MAQQVFNPGDLVRLKSGSPTMTVQANYTVGVTGVHCAWFVNGEAQFAVFTNDALIRLSDLPPAAFDH